VRLRGSVSRTQRRRLFPRWQPDSAAVRRLGLGQSSGAGGGWHVSATAACGGRPRLGCDHRLFHVDLVGRASPSAGRLATETSKPSKQLEFLDRLEFLEELLAIGSDGRQAVSLLLRRG